MLKSPLIHFFVIAFMLLGLQHLFKENVEVVNLSQADLENLSNKDSVNTSRKFLAAAIDELIDKKMLYREGLKLGVIQHDLVITDRMVKNVEFLSVEASEDNVSDADLMALFEEARKLQLFDNDPVIRRRVVQLMEQHIRQSQVIEKPSDAELTEYIRQHSSEFLLPTRWSYEQVFFDPTKHTGQLETVLANALLDLRNTEKEARRIGDNSLLPFHTTLATRTNMKLRFGDLFVTAVTDAPLDRWVGPVKSSFGFHFIRVKQVRRQKTAKLGDVYNRAFIGWLEAKRVSVYQHYMTQLRSRYRVRMEGETEDAIAVVNFSQSWVDSHQKM